ncbi:hypothetical protein H6S82_20255 [Planktothrix sp. FACHB-1355]|uniref:Uncharacterized protein n=1 Tax=Aerosakkonema funiforme FACHB-1375 TaxID=2949571 RepID=A0A926VGA0_9CYAN|nr:MULTISPECIES: hypothetical protein [Oscillatoriales]MBD2182114.1 hypothetical protein [Aerosakkonema funiforme FACHB-1375]MBD3561165.1 hypothetical protein [Planktothrix sp. FACHB-1355]
MFRKFLIFFIALMLCFNLFTLPSISETVPECNGHEEIFTFKLPNYAIQHQGGAILNLKVAYRLTAEAIDQKDYPDLMSVKKDIDNFFISYANETDYWEILNKNLVQFILDKYLQISSLKIEMGVMPTLNEPLFRASIVRSTRPEMCSLRL